MKRSAIFFSLLCLLGWSLSSCSTSQSVVEAMPPPPPPPAEGIVIEEVAEEVSAPAVEEGPRKIVGSYRSVKGVMDPLSCYCSNGGYVDSPAGETLPVCFKDNVEMPSTDYLEATGVMTTRTIDSNGPCPSGTQSYLVVESYKLNP